MPDNKNNTEEIKTESYSLETIEATERASIDSMVATAKRYPRNLKRCTENSIFVVTQSVESAKTCSYALPRGDKQITGPSIHLARILGQNYQNLRVESKITDITPTQVVSQSTCLDLENNYGVRVEVRRSIIGKNGRFNDDLITVTGNACNAISFRNAVLAVIPKPIIDTVYNAAQNTITGDISDEQKLIARRKELLDKFQEQHGATEPEILKLVGKGAIEGIKRDEIVFLIGINQAIKDGDTTADEVFGRNASVQKTADKLKDLASKGYEEVQKKAEQKQSQTGEPPKTGKPGRPAKPDGNINFEPK
jgi:hypothetical protein